MEIISTGILPAFIIRSRLPPSCKRQRKRRRERERGRERERERERGREGERSQVMITEIHTQYSLILRETLENLRARPGYKATHTTCVDT